MVRENPMTVTIKANTEKCVWVACAMLCNLATEINNTSIIPCKLIRMRVMDTLDDKVYYSAGGDYEYVEGSIFMTGSSVYSRDGTQGGVVLFGADRNKEAGRRDFDYVVFRAEIPKGKLSQKQIQEVITLINRNLFLQGNLIGLDARAFRTQDGIILTGVESDVLMIYKELTEWMRRCDDGLPKHKRSPLPIMVPPPDELSLSKAAPSSTLLAKDHIGLLSDLNIPAAVEQATKIERYRKQRIINESDTTWTSSKAVQHEKEQALKAIANACSLIRDFRGLRKHYERMRGDRHVGPRQFYMACTEIGQAEEMLEALFAALFYVQELQKGYDNSANPKP